MKRKNYWFSALVFLTVLLTVTGTLWARAGGGEGFSGGGGGGGGFGGGGDGDGGGGIIIFYIFIWLYDLFSLTGHPCLCYFILIVVSGTVFYFYARAEMNRRLTPTSVPPARYQASTSYAMVVLQQIQAVDPTFLLEEFTLRVTRGFEKIQQGWSNQNLQQVGAFISDGIYERFSLQIREQKENGYRNIMDQVVVEKVTLAQFRQTPNFDEIIVAITASAADYRVKLQDGAFLSGSKEPTRFTEYWSFLRRRGVPSRANIQGLIEGNCPNCGAAIALNQFGFCPHCKALLRSGLYDWVLVEITQSRAFQSAAQLMIPGLHDLQTTDPGFTLAHLEDRVSVIFWRRMEAERIASIDPLRKVAHPKYLKAFAGGLSTTLPRRFIGNCAVGAVDAKRFFHEGDFIHAQVEVCWSGNYLLLDAQGQTHTTDAITSARWIFELVRKNGTLTTLDQALTSNHCPACGAPESDPTVSACAYCNAVLNDGSQDWVLLSSGPAIAYKRIP